jgi:hypothetical protein
VGQAEIALELVGDEIRSSIVLGSGADARRLVVSVPRSTVGLLDPVPDAFAPLVAAVTGDDVAELVPRAAPARVPPWVGLAYDAGMDASATLVDGLANDAAPRITHLLTVAEIDDRGRTILDPRTSGVGVLAAELGLDSVAVATNAYALARDRARSVELGGALWQTVERLVPAFVEIVVPRTIPDPVDVVSRDRRVLRHLVVCTRASAPPSCGQCSACVRARTRLETLGVAVPAGLFEHALTEEAVAACARELDLTVLLGDLASIPDEQARLRDWWARAVAGRLEPSEGAGWSPELGGRVARAATRVSARIPDGVAFGWRPGEVALRPERDAAPRLLRTVRERSARSLAWAMLDVAADGAGAAWCASQLLRDWGPGLLWAYGAEGALDRESLARVLGDVQARVWWSEQGGLDAARLLETIEHGCLPLQAMPEVAAEATSANLPERLRSLVLPIGDGALQPLSDAEVARRLQAAAAELVAGSLERDLRLATSVVG